MKKVFITLCAFALMAGAVSCRKEKIEPVEQDPVPEYAEGIYHPTMKIATVSEDGQQTQEWSWEGDNLDKIIGTDGSTTTYNYSGKYISKVSTTGEQAQEIRYYYTESNAFSSCEIYYDGAKAVSMDIVHNAAGKVSGGEIAIDDYFLLSLAGDLLGFGSAFEKLLGRPACESLILMAQLSQNEGAKFSVGSKVVSMAIEWNGENVSNMVINANITFLLDTNDLNLVQQFIDVPEEYLPLIQMAMAYGGGLPVTLAMNDTISATYDTCYNPMFCNWGMIFSPQNLSLNNVLTQTTSGLMTVTVSLLGQNMELYNTPLNEYEEYEYQYNDKKYPTKVSSGYETVYTYKQ